jgi:hypothetical protein
VRYRRSWGIWLLLLIAPVGARLFVPRSDGTAIVISVGGQLPVMTSAVIGVCLGLVVATLLLPAAYIYLRANTNRLQAWRLEEVAPASPVWISLGRFAADVAILFGALAALTLAGCFLAWLILPPGALDPLELGIALWVVAAPSLMIVAAVRRFFDALPLLRGGLGDFAYLCIWLMTVGAPQIDHEAVGFLANIRDPVGFVRPLVHGAALENPSFAMGSAAVRPGRVPIDAMAGIMSPGYLASRAAWAALAVLLATIAGLVYRPRRARRSPSWGSRLIRIFRVGAPLPADRPAKPALPAASAPYGLVVSEIRLIGSGRLAQLVAFLAAAVGAFGEWGEAGLPLALLWLAFVLSQHAGRSEAKGLSPLSSTLPTGPWVRRTAFVVGGTAWSMLLALPNAILNVDATPLAVAAVAGASAALAASALATLTGSAFAPRVVLLIAWYVYVAG